MSQPISFEAEGTCRDGEILVVRGWPNMACEELPKSKTIYKTVIQKETVEIEVPTEVKSTPYGWWVSAGLALAMIAMILWNHRRQRRKGDTHVYHHKDR